MKMFDFISKYFWLIAIGVTVINALIFKSRAKKHIKENPKLEEGYSTLFRGYFLWANIPWIVMGIGCTIGGVPSIWHYFRPRDGNPYVLVWFASVFFLWILGTYWLFQKGGTEILSTHPGAIILYYGYKTKEITNPTTIKIFWLLALAGGILGVTFMWFMDIPIDTFH
jgi:hypothetical protein